MAPLFLLALLLLRCSSAAAAIGGGAGIVRVALYYEALCPFCSAFITDTLADLLRSGIPVDLRLVPFGNSQIGADGSLVCQHGPGECLLNTVEACALKTYAYTNQYFPFIYCVERLVRSGLQAQWLSCFQEANLKPDSVIDCYNTGRGQQIEVDYAIETAELTPPHQYVPWVLVDGRPLREDYMNVKAYVCNAYGNHPPAGCFARRPMIAEEAKVSTRDHHAVCYKQ